MTRSSFTPCIQDSTEASAARTTRAVTRIISPLCRFLDFLLFYCASAVYYDVVLSSSASTGMAKLLTTTPAIPYLIVMHIPFVGFMVWVLTVAVWDYCVLAALLYGAALAIYRRPGKEVKNPADRPPSGRRAILHTLRFLAWLCLAVYVAGYTISTFGFHESDIVAYIRHASMNRTNAIPPPSREERSGSGERRLSGNSAAAIRVFQPSPAEPFSGWAGKNAEQIDTIMADAHFQKTGASGDRGRVEHIAKILRTRGIEMDRLSSVALYHRSLALPWGASFLPVFPRDIWLVAHSAGDTAFSFIAIVHPPTLP